MVRPDVLPNTTGVLKEGTIRCPEGTIDETTTSNVSLSLVIFVGLHTVSEILT